jgi:hypothetical protein
MSGCSQQWKDQANLHCKPWRPLYQDSSAFAKVHLALLFFFPTYMLPIHLPLPLALCLAYSRTLLLNIRPRDREMHFPRCSSPEDYLSELICHFWQSATRSPSGLDPATRMVIGFT